MNPLNKFKESKKILKSDADRAVLLLKSLSKRERFLSAMSVVLILAIVGLLAENPVKTTEVKSFISNNVPISAIKTSTNLDSFPNVERYSVTGATKTVIYIPQIHKEPTSNSNDAVNDQAYIIQKDIYKTLDQLVTKNNISYVMDETDLYGPMPQDKIDKIKAGLNDVGELRRSLDQTLDSYLKSGGSSESADQIRKSAETKIAAYERNLYLTGGAAVLAAKNPKARVYGSQNAATINEAKSQLQNLVYMENRINEIKGKSSASAGSMSQSQQIQNILSKMGGGSGSSSSLRSLSPVYALAQKNQNDVLKREADDLSAKAAKLSNTKTFETSSVSNYGGSGVSQSSPYAKETNLSKLQLEYDQAYAKFMKLAKDQRSQEAADNVVRQMDDNNQNTSILVLGQQHKDQLIAALNKKGINVIVITPESEMAYLNNQSRTQVSTNSTIK